jgi:hypothetical protein
MRDKTEQAVIADPAYTKTTNRLCGRLILWDVGTPCEDIIVLAPAYCHRKYDLSPQVKLKPYVSGIDDPQDQVAAAVKAAMQRFVLNFYQGPFLKKSLLQ